jgi:hypothetical protein
MAEMGNLIQEGMRFGFLLAADGRQREGCACAALEKEVDRDRRPVHRVKGRSAASLWSQASRKKRRSGTLSDSSKWRETAEAEISHVFGAPDAPCSSSEITARERNLLLSQMECGTGKRPMLVIDQTSQSC